MVDIQAPESEEEELPERLGRYRLVRRISRGGMAQVYEARRESLAGVAPRVALKVILPEHASDPNFRDLFINEARVGSQLQHPNLVQIQDFDQQADLYYLVMEFVEGTTFRRFISLCKRNGVQMPLPIVAELGRQVCEGLHYAHTACAEDGSPRHLVHRDIKPSNVLLDGYGKIKLADFGIASIASASGDPQLTSLTIQLGTPDYNRTRAAGKCEQRGSAYPVCRRKFISSQTYRCGRFTGLHYTTGCRCISGW